MSDLQKLFNNWTKKGPGVYATVDGQYGSTGKGLINGAIGQLIGERFSMFTTNAGPNSGHTFYHGDEKIVLKQLPAAAVAFQKVEPAKSSIPVIYLNGGAVIDWELLQKEVAAHNRQITYVHPTAALITDREKDEDRVTIDRLSSTGQGVGPAIINKIRRERDAVFASVPPITSLQLTTKIRRKAAMILSGQRTLMEVAQGFSLGLNTGMYPYVTSRECTVAQGISDLGMHPSTLKSTLMVVRTFPIRVGNAPDSYSGPCYPDQHEISWGEINQKPEYTTVTGRERRIFTWSAIQFSQALTANRPDIVFVNFMNYVGQNGDRSVVRQKWLSENILEPYRDVMGCDPEAILVGYGPKLEDISIWRQWN